MPLSALSRFIYKVRNRHFLLLDLVIVFSTPFIAIYIRQEGIVNFESYMPQLLYIVFVGSVIKLFIFYSFGIYKQVWLAASIDELARMSFAGILSVIVEIYAFHIMSLFNFTLLDRFPISVPLLDGLTATFLVSMSRFSVRLVERTNQRFKRTNGEKKIGIVGAGNAGIMVLRELFNQPHQGKVVAFFDDDRHKFKKKILGVPVVGAISDMPELVKKYEITTIIVAMPSLPGNFIRKVVNTCIGIKTDIEVLTVPGLNEILDGRVKFDQIRRVQVEDLLRREPIKTDIRKVDESLRDKVVLVTGAGGSIGSELCRQIISHSPRELVLVGHGENSIFEIERELRHRVLRHIYPGQKIKISSRIADVRFKDSLIRIFEEKGPEIVFHAAAHKHVPLMEANPVEAVHNNVLGTKNMVEVAYDYNVERFIYISTDKAVNPTSVMGTTKRIAEMITLGMAKKYQRRFSAVRFGNVLGSRGSVLNTFRQQIMQGGPITVTHPEVIRFFMTIPEAVQLVLQASVLSEGGEVFLLDMGDPVKIIDLAKDFIRLSGFKEGDDMHIEITGMRPGEKLFEELFIKGENYVPTVHDKILIASNASNVVLDDVDGNIDELLYGYASEDLEKVFYLLKAIVPEFNPVNPETFKLADFKVLNTKYLNKPE